MKVAECGLFPLIKLGDSPSLMPANTLYHVRAERVAFCKRDTVVEKRPPPALVYDRVMQS